MRSLNNRLFTELSGQGNYIEFVDRSQKYFNNIEIKLEPWSVDILKSLFGIESNKTDDSDQMVIF